MSLAQQPITITAGGGPQDYIVPGDVGSLIGFLACNVSPVDLIVSYNGRTRWLPMGVLDWFEVDGSLSGPITFSNGQNPNLVGSPTSTVLVTLYRSFDGMPGGSYPIYLGRLINNGNQSVTTAQQLQGTAAQTNAVTELDGSATGGGRNGPILEPTATNQSLYLASRDNLGATNVGLEVVGGVSGGQLKVSNTFLAMNNAALASSSWGVPGIVGFAENVQVAVTTVQTILTYTPVNALAPTTVRVSAFMELLGTSPAAVRVTITWTSENGTTRGQNLAVLNAAALTFADGVNTFTTGTSYALFPVLVTVRANTAIQVSYQNNTATVNDRVTAMIERVSGF